MKLTQRNDTVLICKFSCALLKNETQEWWGGGGTRGTTYLARLCRTYKAYFPIAQISVDLHIFALLMSHLGSANYTVHYSC
jgi:hypothetical protein